MVLGDSEVPLQESILKAPPRVNFPTFAEWVADGNAEQVARSLASSSFTVPDNFTLFITNLSLSYRSNITDGVGFIAIPELGGGVLIVASEGGSDSTSVSNMTYSMPIKVSSGQVISVGSSQAGALTGELFGFLLSNKISIR